MQKNKKYSIEDVNLQKILVFEYFYLKRGLETLSEIYGIPIIDLKYFFYSVEANSIKEKYKKEFEDLYIPDSLEELESFLILTFKKLLNNAKPKEAAELIEKVVPQIINLHRKEVKYKDANLQIIGQQQVNILEEKNTFVPIDLEYVTPSLLTEEELEKIKPANFEELNES